MKVLGLMSGTSLDGLDVALCEFENSRYSILKATTFEYPHELRSKLLTLQDLSGLALMKLDRQWAEFAVESIKGYNFEGFDLLASHGHTVFHKPDEKLTYQLGSGAILRAELGVSVVSDFRRVDVALGGQGAPLVPGAEIELFTDFDCCLNLGGIANVTHLEKRIAFDICPCNLVLNFYAQKLGFAFDKNGENARFGTVDKEILKKWDSWIYYLKEPPKSLGIEDLGVFFNQENPVDMLRTAVEHIGEQVAFHLNGKTLVTGGGAYNQFLIEKIKKKVKNAQIIVPDNLLVEYKEALCFAFLGLKRFLGKDNVFSSFTGAVRNSCSGALY